ncbi:NAD(P)H-quinone oxidoreductase subunit 2 [Striga asiatica]|uniref:NAD(P)H-quinone oxidoreductase subunit 2 n=1 Tax=Striga asiatica TaxID=4170 RepID=A0A5A7QPC3_STRAF|nr:NAD(P)H-quinone oxidoreductase subunit 2 [Striga asiatica]
MRLVLVDLGEHHMWITSTSPSAAAAIAEDAEFGPTVPVRAHHVVRLRVFRPDHPLEVGPHVRHLPLFGPLPGHGQHPSPHGRGPQHLHHPEIILGGLPPHRVAHLAAVAVHAPNGLVRQPHSLVMGLLALQGDADEAQAHILQEPARLEGQFQD